MEQEQQYQAVIQDLRRQVTTGARLLSYMEADLDQKNDQIRVMQARIEALEAARHEEAAEEVREENADVGA